MFLKVRPFVPPRSRLHNGSGLQRAEIYVNTDKIVRAYKTKFAAQDTITVAMQDGEEFAILESEENGCYALLDALGIPRD